MASQSSKALPFLALAIASLFVGLDTFTEFEISQQMIDFMVLILPPTVFGGIINIGIKKGFDAFKAVKQPLVQPTPQPSG